jgi:hypothetical protein
LTRLGDGLLGNPKNFAARAAIAFGFIQDFLVTGVSGNTSFYSWHLTIPLRIRQHTAHKLHVVGMNIKLLAQLALPLARFLGKDVTQV